MFKEFDYQLSKDCPYKGSVKLKILPFIERNDLLKKVNFKIDNTKADLAENLDTNGRLAQVVKENVLTMDVSKGKHKFKSLEELDYDLDVAEFYSEVGVVLCRGIDLGKS